MSLVNRQRGFVYFVRCDANGATKIGWASNPNRRLRQLATLSPVPLRLLGMVRGGDGREEAMHHKFRHLRSHGEWFRDAPELRAFIAKTLAKGGV